LSPTQIDIATHWNPWTDVHTVFADCGVNDVYPQPVLSDIEFDTDGSMILAFFDRWGHQTGEATNYPNGVFGEQGTVAGDVMRAFFNAGSFSLENNGVVGPLTVGGTVAENNYNVSSLRAPNGQGRGGREFYFGDTWVNTHDERSMGSLALLPGSGQVVMTAMDAAYIIYSGGVIYLNNTTGLQDRAFTVYSGGTASFGKAYALGDIELQCDPAPIQIGNYVWIDEDEDGVQDPCEEVIPDGLPISLYNKTTSAWVAVTTTTDGQYYFDDVTPNTAYAIVFGYDYTNMSSIWTPATMQLVLGGIPYELTPANTGEGTNPSLNDSDATLMNVAGLTGYPIIMYTVGRGTDHKLDLGLVNRCVPPSATFVPVPGDCTGVTINNNGRIVLTTVTGADKYGVSLPGAALYDGPDYATATVLPTLYADIVTNVPNTGLTYIVRIFNGDNGCFTDYTVEVPNTNCPIDPQGHIYCEETGEIIMGGSISVTGPGTFVITLDGSTGEYQFYTDGTPGVYNITYTPPVGYTASTTRLPAGTLDPTGQPDPYIIGSGSTDGVLLDDYTAAANVFHLAIDFALGDPEVFNNNIPLEGCSVTLGSTVFEDANNNGVQDASESGIAGVQVQLFSPGPDGMVGGGDDVEINVGPDGNLDTADDAPGGMLTNANGDYFFQGLDAGDYYVQIGAGEFGAGQPLELVNISSNTASGTFAGETDPDDNTDNDDEGTQPGGVGTVTTSGIVTLSANAEPTDATTETAQGNTQDNADDDNGNMTLDFGFYAPVSLGDYTWIDTDGNGAQNGGEPDLPGVVVTLYTSGGTPVTTDAEGNSLPGAIPGQMTTDGTGFYEFTNLPPGNYYVVFDIAGVTGADFYDFTTQGTATEATDSDANPATGQSDNTGALASGDNYPDLDAGVVCTVEVEAGMGATICSTATVDLTALGASIAPSVVGFAGTWTSSGTGIFNDANAGRFGVATTYSPSPADALAGQVILTLTSDDPAAFGAPACDPVSDDVLIVILKVDCGSFPWDGN
jgi:hypothetical protein